MEIMLFYIFGSEVYGQLKIRMDGKRDQRFVLYIFFESPRTTSVLSAFLDRVGNGATEAVACLLVGWYLLNAFTSTATVKILTRYACRYYMPQSLS